jgi:hypothetical protein
MRRFLGGSSSEEPDQTGREDEQTQAEPGNQNESDSDPAATVSERDTDPESVTVATRDEGEDGEERVARLRNLDEEIRRRGGELRLTKNAESGGAPGARRTATRMRPAPSVARNEELESRLNHGLARAEEQFREQLYKLAGRVEALETSLQETQRRNWEKFAAQHESVNERLGELETVAGEAAAKAAKVERRLGDRLRPV